MKVISGEGHVAEVCQRVIHGPIVGELLGLDPDGVPLVDYPGNTHGMLHARTLISMPSSQVFEGMEVLLQFEQSLSGRPIITGIVSDHLVNNEIKILTLNSDLMESALVDGKKVRVDAREEIELVCGRSSILLRNDGKIVIKGMEITSRAAASNKIRGGSVSIN
ncbi:Uncharacterised protein [BD1-7 clade bacterium]|uniref:DUF6484 domain-containing protein n=1 Tax=BD1-7 clade bacterium TaxID=2029982 RepID=A0A5S9NUC2_9GAMM|nr:Uncharacterised protein [BD1-7 clade bacterium]CAA0109521.1 Uncharacterised protein [BD1-7 clade bacterium]